MKKLIVGLCLLSLVISNVVGAANLRWDSSEGDVDGYIVYYGTSGEGEYTENINVGNVMEVLDIDNTLHLHPGETYTAIVRAYNDKGESGPSNSVEYTAPAFTPPDDKLPPIIITLPGPVTITINNP